MYPIELAEYGRAPPQSSLRLGQTFDDDLSVSGLLHGLVIVSMRNATILDGLPDFLIVSMRNATT
jgi:hypothetical protein